MINLILNSFYQILISDNGLIYAENIDINHINYVIDVVSTLSQKVVCDYRKNILNKESKMFILDVKQNFKNKFKNSAIIDYEVKEKKIENFEKYNFIGNSGNSYVAPIAIKAQNGLIFQDILYSLKNKDSINNIVTKGLYLKIAGFKPRTIYNNNTDNEISLILIKNVMDIVSYNDFDKINPENYQ